MAESVDSAGGCDAGVAQAHGQQSKSVHTVWNGVDVVLTNSCYPREADEGCVEEKKDYPLKDRAPRRPKPDAGLRSSWRRMSSSQENDHGWFRQLDLRNDVPTIDEIRDWSFDVLQFEDSVLVQVFIRMLEYYNLMEEFRLDRETLERYCKKVMEMHHLDSFYQKVDNENDEVGEERKHEILCEYHCWYHAVSCAHVSFLFLTLGGADAFLKPIELFCIMMGGLIHDLDHPGNNNDFEVKSNTTLAKMYENDSVLERHAINTWLKMCQENPDLDWLKSFQDMQKFEYMKHFISESVLATDPARHGAIVDEALAFLDKGPQDYASSSSSESSQPSTALSTAAPTLTYFDREDPDHRLFIGRLILHSVDISNPAHPSFEVASDWAIRVITEFSRQARKEKQLQLPVTPFMDGLDSQVKIAKLQIGFFNWMVKPLFNTIGLLFSDLKHLETWGDRNCDEYQVVIDQHEERNETQDIHKKDCVHENEG